MLLREAQLDPLLKRYDVVIIDEAHERTANADVLCMLLRRAQRERADLRSVIMSATVDVDKFTTFVAFRLVHELFLSFFILFYFILFYFSLFFCFIFVLTRAEYPSARPAR